MGVAYLNVLSSNLKIYGKLIASMSKINPESCTFIFLCLCNYSLPKFIVLELKWAQIIELYCLLFPKKVIMAQQLKK